MPKFTVLLTFVPDVALETLAAGLFLVTPVSVLGSKFCVCHVTNEEQVEEPAGTVQSVADMSP